ncbi:MAG: ATP-binding cassette domain-containing protein [Oscillospiraceae bacterium]|nr:ATP-binding cassette domain-containing protein [Oscillospiraceae bacterium]
MYLSRINKSYPTDVGKKLVLCNFSADIPDGCITVITGKSGCGKTTLLRIIAGLEDFEGEIHGNAGKKIAMVFQENRLCPQLSALGNCIAAGCKSDEALDALKSMGFEESDTAVPAAALSGGMCRRGEIARCLTSDGEILLMDEPFAGLDGVTKERTIETIKRLRKGRTTVIVTHTNEQSLFEGKTIAMKPVE